MEFITSHFKNFTFSSYITFIIVVLCFFLSKNLNENRKNSPVLTLIIANVAFWYFIDSIPGNFDIYIQIITFSSVLCICWFYWIKINENQENEDRGFLNNGKESVANGYNDVKQSVKDAASESVGGGFFGELLGNAVDIGARKADNKVSSFLDFLGDSSEYFHPSRGTINTLRNILIIAIILSMFHIT